MTKKDWGGRPWRTSGVPCKNIHIGEPFIVQCRRASLDFLACFPSLAGDMEARRAGITHWDPSEFSSCFWTLNWFNPILFLKFIFDSCTQIIYTIAKLIVTLIININSQKLLNLNKFMIESNLRTPINLFRMCLHWNK